MTIDCFILKVGVVWCGRAEVDRLIVGCGGEEMLTVECLVEDEVSEELR